MPPDATLFREVIALRRDRLDIARAAMASFLQASGSAVDGLSLGLSPHAPYSCHPELVAETVRLAELHRLPLAIHLWWAGSLHEWPSAH